MRPFARRLCVLVLCCLTAGCATGHLRREGMKAFERGDYEEAIANLEEAARKDPSNLELRLDLRVCREQAKQLLLEAADRARARGDLDGAAASYRRVLTLEPGNRRALQGLEGVEADRRHAESVAGAAKLFEAKQLDAAEQAVRAVLTEDRDFAAAHALLAKIDLARGPRSAEPRLKPRDNRPVSLQFRDTPIKVVFDFLAKQTGLNFVFDKEVKSDAKTTIFVNEIPVERAIDLIVAQNQLCGQVLSENLVLIYPNTPAKQKDYRDEIVHTFYLTNAAPKDAESLLKTVLGAKTLFIDERSSTLVLRDTPEHVRMAEKLLASLDVSEPEVIMEVEVLEITHSLAQQLGINYPYHVAFSPTGLKSASSLVLSDLGKQNKDTITVSPLSVSIDFLKTVGATNVLASPRIRARNKERAKILVGDKLPVVTSGTSATVGGAFSTSNVQYVEAGLSLEVEPKIRNDGNVAIKVALEVSSIVKEINVPIGNGGTTLAYQIGTRSASTLLELRDGETQVLAGLIQANEQRTSSRIPGLGDLPVLGHLFGSTSTNNDKTEIVLSITPRIIRAQERPSTETTEFWYGSDSQLSSASFAGSGSPAAGSAQAISGAAPTAPGGVSLSAGSAPATSAPAAPVSSGPRALPERIEAAAKAPPPAGAVAATTADAKAAATSPLAADATPAAQGAAAPDTRPQVTIEGPEKAKVGEEVSLSVKLASASPLGRIRTQVGFDATAVQLVSAEPGDLAPSGEVPKVEVKPGGVQLELAGSEGAPISGRGSLVDLRFRVVAPRPIAVTTQVVLVGEDGVAVGATQATPLTITVAQ